MNNIIVNKAFRIFLLTVFVGPILAFVTNEQQQDIEHDYIPLFSSSSNIVFDIGQIFGSIALPWILGLFISIFIMLGKLLKKHFSRKETPIKFIDILLSSTRAVTVAILILAGLIYCTDKEWRRMKGSQATSNIRIIDTTELHTIVADKNIKFYTSQRCLEVRFPAEPKIINLKSGDREHKIYVAGDDLWNSKTFQVASYDFYKIPSSTSDQIRELKSLHLNEIKGLTAIEGSTAQELFLRESTLYDMPILESKLHLRDGNNIATITSVNIVFDGHPLTVILGESGLNTSDNADNAFEHLSKCETPLK